MVYALQKIEHYLLANKWVTAHYGDPFWGVTLYFF
jgi:hypothetical protein